MSIVVGYERSINAELYRSWKNKRQTGMKVSWRYEIPPEEAAALDYRFAEENKYFTLLANVIHQQGGLTRDMEDLLREIREKEKLVKPDCKVGLLSNKSKSSINKKFGNISHYAAIYKDEISEEHLEIAARIYF